jgi:hypothetical protein
MRKIELVYSAMDGINFHRGDYIKTSLLKAKRHSSCAGKEVDADWTHEGISPGHRING